jgi:hypothetical protein
MHLPQGTLLRSALAAALDAEVTVRASTMLDG